MNNTSESKLCSRTKIRRRARYRKVIIDGLTSSSTDSSSSQDDTFSKIQRRDECDSLISGTFHL